ncbi:hypothetical protein TYRP_007709 [Tyrophagus putrescentiae]|nr:hypothetical protein TYRP_007709 [Tyrophagus putrescentiae]
MSDRSDLDLSDFDHLLIGASNSEDTGINLTNDSVLNTTNMAASTPPAVTNVTNNYSNINVSTLYDGENYVVSKLLTSSPRKAASSSTAPSSASTSALSQIQRNELFLSLFQPFLKLGSLVLGDLVGARIRREILSLILRLIL